MEETQATIGQLNKQLQSSKRIRKRADYYRDMYRGGVKTNQMNIKLKEDLLFKLENIREELKNSRLSHLSLLKQHQKLKATHDGLLKSVFKTLSGTQLFYPKEGKYRKSLEVLKENREKEIPRDSPESCSQKDTLNDSKTPDIQNYKILKEELCSLFECPITFEEISTPVILPSGHTVEKSTMDKLIDNSSKDPFSNTEKCTQIIVNRFALKVKEILSEIS